MMGRRLRSRRTWGGGTRSPRGILEADGGRGYE